MEASTAFPPWLLLVHQLPPRPTSARVKTWRRLQALGAVAIKNSVYVLPNTPQAREDLEWVRTEILALGGEATIFAADRATGLGGDHLGDLVAVFHRAREQDYRRLDAEVERLRARAAARKAPARPALERAVRALRRRFEEVARIDFFAAPAGRETAGALAALERALERPAAAAGVPAPLQLAADFRHRRWLTRPRPGVDRMASAWLIRRFIDAEAEFQFSSSAAGPGAVNTSADAPAAIPFDMFGAEFSHHGSGCTFETLSDRFGLREPALRRLAEIVHDCDLNDHRYGAPETVAVGRLVEGLRLATPDDRVLIEQGITLFEALYRSFASELPAATTTVRKRRRQADGEVKGSAKKTTGRTPGRGR